MKTTFRMYPKENDVFAPDAFKDMIGKPFMVTIGPGKPVKRTLIAAKVQKSGKYAELTVDL